MYPKTPKALFLISPNSRELIEKIEEEGINEIIMKPILYSEFYNHIKNIYENPIKKSLNFHNKTVDLSTISGSHILIVEDNEINREILRGSLEYEGFIVELAEDSTTAMKKLYEHNFDLLIVDLQIPLIENNDFLVETRKVLKFNELPIIAIGSTPISSTREKAREIGINDYLSKPINADNLFKSCSLLRIFLVMFLSFSDKFELNLLVSFFIGLIHFNKISYKLSALIGFDK
jgi:CheY-like chemotaxis protein